jgi:hypothetical protein
LSETLSNALSMRTKANAPFHEAYRRGMPEGYCAGGNKLLHMAKWALQRA